MGHLDDAGERLRRSGMRRHQLGAVKDPDEAILDEGLDVVAYESMRHTVSVAADERDRAITQRTPASSWNCEDEGPKPC